MDVLVIRGDRLFVIEIKSAATVAPEFFRHFEAFAERLRGTGLPETIENIVVFGGEPSQSRSMARVVGWRDVDRLLP